MDSHHISRTLYTSHNSLNYLMSQMRLLSTDKQKKRIKHFNGHMHRKSTAFETLKSFIAIFDYY